LDFVKEITLSFSQAFFGYHAVIHQQALRTKAIDFLQVMSVVQKMLKHDPYFFNIGSSSIY
jgi:hypothetical protein